jgi:hypothetical protein
VGAILHPFGVAGVVAPKCSAASTDDRFGHQSSHPITYVAPRVPLQNANLAT